VTAPRLAELELLERETRGRVSWLVVACRAEGIPVEVFETGRSPDRQAELYARGRDPDAVDYGRTVTRAMPWHPAHQYGLAADLVFRVGGRWTWYEPGPDMWTRMHALAEGAGLHVLRDQRGRVIEMPHVEVAGFNWAHQTVRGPNETEAWLAWLRGRAG
jgi:peptidoglycan LD-endopeptidase CwlK